MGVLWMVRHGQAGPWPQNYDQLSPLGKRQARSLGERWAEEGLTFERVYVGPRVRHRLTHDEVAAAYAARDLPWPEPTLLPQLDEFPAEEIITRLMPQLADRDEAVRVQLARLGGSEPKGPALERLLHAVVGAWSREEVGEAGIETFAQFLGRVREATSEMTNGDGAGEQVVAFTSGGPLGVSAGHALALANAKTLDLIWQVRNTGLLEILYSHDRLTVRSFNDVAHLRTPEEVTYR